MLVRRLIVRAVIDIVIDIVIVDDIVVIIIQNFMEKSTGFSASAALTRICWRHPPIKSLPSLFGIDNREYCEYINWLTEEISDSFNVVSNMAETQRCYQG